MSRQHLGRSFAILKFTLIATSRLVSLCPLPFLAEMNPWSNLVNSILPHSTKSAAERTQCDKGQSSNSTISLLSLCFAQN
ncbi:hypothetical protein CI102_10342 [Trichoderma harzianum]|nr:hypothetical protein CI102_10342 [Trichoderma harzianum]